MVVLKPRVKHGTSRRTSQAMGRHRLRHKDLCVLKELRRTNDLVWISMAEAALAARGIDYVVLDGAISAMEGSIGAFPRRLMVLAEDYAAAKAHLAALEASLPDG